MYYPYSKNIRINLNYFGDSCYSNHNKGDVVMKFNEEAIKKIGEGMRKATEKYNLPTRPKKNKNKNKK